MIFETKDQKRYVLNPTDQTISGPGLTGVTRYMQGKALLGTKGEFVLEDGQIFTTERIVEYIRV